MVANLPSKPAILPTEAGPGFHAEAWFMAPAGAPSSTSVHIEVAMTALIGYSPDDGGAISQGCVLWDDVSLVVSQ